MNAVTPAATAQGEWTQNPVGTLGTSRGWDICMSQILADERELMRTQLDLHHVSVQGMIDTRFRLLERRLMQQNAGSDAAACQKQQHETSPLRSVAFSSSAESRPVSGHVDILGPRGSPRKESDDGQDVQQGLSQSRSSHSSKPTVEKQDSASVYAAEKQYRISKAQREIQMLITPDGPEYTPNSSVSFATRIDKFTNGPFDKVMGGLIVLNTLVTFLEMQRQGGTANYAVGLQPDNIGANLNTDFIQVSEYVFTAIFSLELLLRIYVQRAGFFYKGYNLLDAVIVALSFVDAFVFSQSDATGTNVSFIRIVRAARMLRTLGHFKELQVLLKTIVSSIMAIFWSMLLMMIIQLMGACILCQTLNGFIIDESQDLEVRIWVNRMYGDGMKSMYTMFEATFSGCWPNYARPLIEHVSGYYAIFFMTYAALVIFALTRIVSALFLKETFNQSTAEAESMVREKKKESENLMNQLHAIFQEADVSGDGHLTGDELNHMLAHNNVVMLLGKLGVDTSDGQKLFEMLDDEGSGQISRNDFVSGFKRLKGEARSIDLISLSHKVHQILLHCKTLEKNYSEHQALEFRERWFLRAGADVSISTRQEKGLLEAPSRRAGRVEQHSL